MTKILLKKRTEIVNNLINQNFFLFKKLLKLI